MSQERSIQVIKDLDGRNVAIINDIIFKSRKRINWKDVEAYLKKYVDEFYEIAETKDIVYIGSDLPDEYVHSNYSYSLHGSLTKVKANLVQAIPEAIEIATNKRYKENLDNKHNKDAKNGWYRYDTRFCMPIYNMDGIVSSYNSYNATLIVRIDSNCKLYLYDVINIKKR